ncbi:MAG: LysM peptidoglycan-binding domain-containing protein [Candidatus Falkowbacteria bacterium]
MKRIYLTLIVAVIFCIISANVNAKTKTRTTSNAPAGTPIIYTVAKGNCLSTIADKFGLSVAELYNLNKSKISDKSLIYAGQKFIVGYQETVQPQTTTVVSGDGAANTFSQNYFGYLLPFCLYVAPSDSTCGQSDPTIADKEEYVEADRILIAKAKLLGIKYNTQSSKLYSAKEIIKSFQGKLIYCKDKSFVLDKNGAKMYLRQSDKDILLWACYGLGIELYDCQDPKMIIEAHELGIKFNHPGGRYHDREEIVQSMYDENGRKKVAYSRSMRFQWISRLVYLDCSAFAYFLSNCYAQIAPGNTSLTIFTAKHGRRLVTSVDQLKPGDLVGRPGVSEGHVVTYLGNGKFAHSSGDKPLFTDKDQIGLKKGLFCCRPQPNRELENSLLAHNKILSKKFPQSIAGNK